MPRADIFADPGIWVCLDEGCNSNCHGAAWAQNVEEKLKTTCLKQGFEWMHHRERKFKGIGGAEVVTTGKRKLPTAFRLTKSKKVLPGFLESHEQPGGHPLLLSDASQSRLGFVKDMGAGKVYLKDYNDFVDLYRAEGSGLRVICVSHFPEHPSLIGDLVGRDSDPEELPPHETLVANPATSIKIAEKKSKIKEVHIMSHGIEDQRPHIIANKKDRDDISAKKLEEIMESVGWDAAKWSQYSGEHQRALVRRLIE